MAVQNNNRGIRLTLIWIFVVIALVMLGFINKINQPRILSPEQLMKSGAILLDTPRKFSGFELTDHNGQLFTPSNLEGKWSLLFFGFTHCPDICPTTMATTAKLYESMLEEDKEKLQVVLVSPDPERDTPEKLSQYVPFFNKEFIGATGNKHILMSLGVQLNIPYSRVSLTGGDYTIDHSGNLVIINPYGHYHGFFRPPFDIQKMKVSLKSIMVTFDQQK
jgi:protein SCO1/2